MPEVRSPRLPWDVLLLVFKEADPSTLAVLGRVSLDFLASTAPILYRDVEVSSVESLNKLFKRQQIGRTTKNSSAMSRINSHLNLDQIRVLSINFRRVPIDSQLEISSSRIHQSPLLLDNLKISYDYQVSQGGYGPFQRLYASLFRHLNPLQCAYHLIGRPTADAHGWVVLHSHFTAGWTRIQEIELAGGILYSRVGRVEHLGGLPPPSLLRRRTVRLDVASLLSHAYPSARTFVYRVEVNRDLFELGKLQDGSVVLVVGSEAEKREAEAGIQEVEQQWRSRLAVEVRK